MALQNQKALYEIELRRTGAGAQQAVADLKSVQTAAAQSNTVLVTGAAASTASLATFTNSTKSTVAGLKAMQGAATLIGMQAFPQMTMAAMTAQTAFSGVRSAAAAMGVGIKLAGGAFAVFAASAYSAITAVRQFMAMNKAFAQSDKSELDTAEGLRDNAEGMRKKIADSIANGDLKLTDAEAARIEKLLNLGGNRVDLEEVLKMVNSRMTQGYFMSDSERSSLVSTRLGDQRRSQANSAATLELSNPEAFNQRDFQKLQVQMQYNDQIKLFNELREEGLITEQQLTNMTVEADTARKNSLIGIKKQLTDVQQLGQAVAQNFAGGMSAALVDVWTEGGEAMKKFFSQFMRMTAEMIIQLLIIRALKSMGLMAGGGGQFMGDINGGGAGANMAALGGLFPRMMASGGLAGVTSVSSPTYFPKFNVIAGEAGREMMTVLARPRMMEIGGMEAVVGNAGNNRLAITSADQLAAGSARGTIVIQIQGTPDYEARVIHNSIAGAVVRVVNDMKQDTAISRGVKQLTV